MRRHFILPLLLFCALNAVSANAATGKVIKMLPFFLDEQGQHMRGANLYDRDSYQVYLRKHPELRKGMRFDVQWKSHGSTTAPLKIRIELRGGQKGGAPQQLTLEDEVKTGKWFSSWTTLHLLGDDYKKFGELMAWRATLWEGDKMIGEQKSFLW
jgi:hypothetical protein